MFKSKKLVALGLAAVALFSTVGVSLAYWASTVTGNNTTATGTLTVGTGNTVTTTVTVGPETGGALVPAGHAVDGGEVAQVDFVFDVSWDSTGLDGEGATSTLTVAESSRLVKNAGGTTITDEPTRALYVVDLPDSATIYADGADVGVTVSVTLSEPTLAQYPSVAGGSVVFTFTFTVA